MLSKSIFTASGEICKIEQKEKNFKEKENVGKGNQGDEQIGRGKPASGTRIDAEGSRDEQKRRDGKEK
jgi:hypothetical protein